MKCPHCGSTLKYSIKGDAAKCSKDGVCPVAGMERPIPERDENVRGGTEEMNREHWKAMLPIIQAFVEGKTVECKKWGKNHVWEAVVEPRFDADASEYRIKPESKLRPWKPEEVPIGAVVRDKSTKRERDMILACTYTQQVVLPGVKGTWELSDMLTYWELLDGSPCGVEVSE